MDHRLPAGANPAPSPCKTRLAKQIAIDRQGVKARHVATRFSALDIEMIGLGDHERRIVILRDRVQREF